MSVAISIDYNGSFPNLCSGELLVSVIDGDEAKVFKMDHCLASGGSVVFDADMMEHVSSGKWSWKFYDDSDIPEGFKPYMDATLKLVNKELPHGCCGGCV